MKHLMSPMDLSVEELDRLMDLANDMAVIVPSDPSFRILSGSIFSPFVSACVMMSRSCSAQSRSVSSSSGSYFPTAARSVYIRDVLPILFILPNFQQTTKESLLQHRQSMIMQRDVDHVDVVDLSLYKVPDDHVGLASR